MTGKVALYYSVSEKAGMAYDIKTSDNCKAYMKVEVNSNKDLSEKSYVELGEAFKELISNKFEVDKEYLTLVSEKEYLINTDDEDEEDEECE